MFDNKDPTVNSSLNPLAVGCASTHDNLMPSLESIAGQAIEFAQTDLQRFASAPDLMQKLEIPYGTNFNHNIASQMFQAIASGDLSVFPPIQILSANVLQGANGAFAAETGMIYLNDRFVAANAGNIDAITGVVLEEVGHSFDPQINTVDSLGDEGEMFSLIVRGRNIDPVTLKALTEEDDHSSFTLDGNLLKVELSSYQLQGSIGYLYNNNTSISSRLGAATNNEVYLGNETWRQDFQNGIIIHSNSNGTHTVWGSIGWYYQSNPSVAANLGVPLADEVYLDNGNWQQSFKGGTIDWLNTNTARVTYNNGGAIPTVNVTATALPTVIVTAVAISGNPNTDPSYRSPPVVELSESSPTINYLNFTGVVTPNQGGNTGVNLRNSSNYDDRSNQNRAYGETLSFDAWTTGTPVYDFNNSSIVTDLWFRVAGTNFWVPDAYINENYNSGGSGGSNTGGSNNSAGSVLPIGKGLVTIDGTILPTESQTGVVFPHSWIGGTAKKIDGKEIHIALERINSPGYIENKPTWIVIHGWNNSYHDSDDLAKAIDGYQEGDQVLTLDWQEGSMTGFISVPTIITGLTNLVSGISTGTTEVAEALYKASSWIKPVADATTQILTSWGISREKINLVGHSFGSYVAYEISKNLDRVNNLVALDPG